ncbi:MAG TPA: ankyrin repeat domain-containing protein, partial [Acidiphilium sp.]
MIAFKPAHAAAVLVSMFALTGTAAAQMPQPGAPMGGPAVQPKIEPQQVPPPALPGAAEAGDVSEGLIATAGEDPTKLLFSAINHGNYAEARVAVSRGANLDAVNALGETPIEMSVELNRNNITFMLLSTRQEEGPTGGTSVTALPVSASKAVPVRPIYGH